MVFPFSHDHPPPPSPPSLRDGLAILVGKAIRGSYLMVWRPCRRGPLLFAMPLGAAASRPDDSGGRWGKNDLTPLCEGGGTHLAFLGSPRKAILIA